MIKLILKILFLGNIFNLVLSFKKPTLLKMVSNEDYNKILKYKSFIKNEDPILLFDDIKNNKISEIIISPTFDEIISVNNDEDKHEIIMINKNEFENINKYNFVKINPILTKNVIDLSVTNSIKTTFIEKPFFGFNILNSATNIAVPVFSIIILRNIISMFRTKSNMTIPTLPFMSSFSNVNKDKILLEKLNISLSSWAGSPEVFEECTEIISFLKNSTLYIEAGAELPRGILLEGLPGTGKTLLAKAIASECEANFISIPASEFIELYIGMGAFRVRKLFETARNNKPCIIFIDEIDAIGRQRNSGGNFGTNDEREQTLNQLLTEMDGFKENDGIIVIAATNLKNVLDKALLRPGRFDRIINIPLPDKNSRAKILDLYLQSKNCTISTNDIADLTNGFSGADLKNLINEAIMTAVRRGSKYINFKDISDSLEKMLVGIIKRNDDRSFQTIRRVAIHEIGHAYLANYFKEYFNLQKVSIQSTYSGAGGYTLFNELDILNDGGLYSKDYLKKQLIVMLGGKAAETIFFGEELVSLGATQDLKEANSLAKKMINKFGFGSKLEIFYNDNDVQYNSNNDYSEKTKEKIDEESYNLIIDAYQEAKHIINNNKEIVEKIILDLIEKKIIYGEEFYNLIEFFKLNYKN